MKNTNRPALSVGQTLWWVSAERVPRTREVTVLKVGRKWAELDNNKRIDIQTWVADGGQFSPPGACYASRAEYEQEQALANAWFKFRQDVQLQSASVEGVTVEDIQRARELLKMPKRVAN